MAQLLHAYSNVIQCHADKLQSNLEVWLSRDKQNRESLDLRGSDITTTLGAFSSAPNELEGGDTPYVIRWVRFPNLRPFLGDFNEPLSVVG